MVPIKSDRTDAKALKFNVREILSEHMLEFLNLMCIVVESLRSVILNHEFCYLVFLSSWTVNLTSEIIEKFEHIKPF